MLFATHKWKSIPLPSLFGDRAMARQPFISQAFGLTPTGGITKRENEVKSMALVFSELRKGMEK